jgi:6-phosphogluconolactonase (cycloisomerase 2 family)
MTRHIGRTTGIHRNFAIALCTLALSLLAGSAVAHAQYVYVANTGDTVSAFRADPVAGLSLIGTFPTGNAVGGPQALAVDPLNRFVFVANPAARNITGFRIGLNGRLTFIGATPLTPIAPEALAIDLSGRFLYSAGGDGVNPGNASSVIAFQISSSGLLVQIGEWPGPGVGGNSITVAPSGAFVYGVGSAVAAPPISQGFGDLEMFRILSNGTLAYVDQKVTEGGVSITR